MKYLGVQNIQKKFLLTYITDYCNFDCKYCGLHDQKNKWPSKEVIRMFNIYNKLDNILPIIHGGEPTTYPNIDILLKFLKIPFVIFTNFTKPVSYFRNLKNSTSITGLNVSLHPKFVKNLDEFILKANTVNEFIPINMNVLLEHDDIEYYNKCNEQLICSKKNFIPIRINSAILNHYNRDDFYNFELDAYKDLPYYTFIKEERGIQEICREIDFTPDIGPLGRVRCDIKKWQRLFTSNGDYYFCNRNKKPLFNFFEKSDEYIIEKINEDNFVTCNDVPCSLCIMRYGTKERIDEDILDSYEQYSKD